MKETHERYRSIEETARDWGMTPRNIRVYCAQGRIPGAWLEGKSWRIPIGAEKPARKPRGGRTSANIAALLAEEMKGQLRGGLYHRLQIDLTYNSNHMEGSRLTHEQTRWIFETHTIGELQEDIPVDDIVETANHFRAVDTVIAGCGAALTEAFIKRLHAILKSGTSDSRRSWFSVGGYKKRANTVGTLETSAPENVHRDMAALLERYRSGAHDLEGLLDFHVGFETIHPFQDGNGRIGRLVLLKECLKHNVTPFIIDESLRPYYYRGLDEWRRGEHGRLLDTCRTGQNRFAALLRFFEHASAAAAADARDGRTFQVQL